MADDAKVILQLRGEIAKLQLQAKEYLESGSAEATEERKTEIKRIQDSRAEKDTELLNLRVEVQTLQREKTSLQADYERRLDDIKAELKLANENGLQAKFQITQLQTTLDKVQADLKVDFNPDKNTKPLIFKL